MNTKTKGTVINLKKVACPKCGTDQPPIRRPKDIKELLVGGWTCNNCNCKIDRYGSERK